MRDRCTLGAVSSAGAAAAGRRPARRMGGLTIILVALAWAPPLARCYPLGAFQAEAALPPTVSEYIDSATSKAFYHKPLRLLRLHVHNLCCPRPLMQAGLLPYCCQKADVHKFAPSFLPQYCRSLQLCRGWQMILKSDDAGYQKAWTPRQW